MMDSNFASYLSTIFFAWTLVSMLGALVVFGFDSQELKERQFNLRHA